jgi:CheY-like chemotaxis protein
MSAKVLLVEDSSTALLLEETVLKKHTAYEVVTARDGEEAVLKAVTEKPDLILMDVVMAKIWVHRVPRDSQTGRSTAAVCWTSKLSRRTPDYRTRVECGWQCPRHALSMAHSESYGNVAREMVRP